VAAPDGREGVDLRQSVQAPSDAPDRDERRELPEHHVERSAGWMRDAENRGDGDELARVPERNRGREGGEIGTDGQQEHPQRHPRRGASCPFHQVDLRSFRASFLRRGIRTRKMSAPSRLTATATRYGVNWSENAAVRPTAPNPNSTTPAAWRTPIPLNEMGSEIITASSGTKRKKYGNATWSPNERATSTCTPMRAT